MKRRDVKRFVEKLRKQQHAYERIFRLLPDGDKQLQHYWSTAKAIQVIADEMERELLGREPKDTGSMCQ